MSADSAQTYMALIVLEMSALLNMVLVELSELVESVIDAFMYPINLLHHATCGE